MSLIFTAAFYTNRRDTNTTIDKNDNINKSDLDKIEQYKQNRMFANKIYVPRTHILPMKQIGFVNNIYITYKYSVFSCFFFSGLIAFTGFNTFFSIISSESLISLSV